MNTQENSERDSVESTALFALSDIKQTIYEHGGCRIFFEKGRHRQLIADGYQDEPFAVALRKFVEDYYANSRDQSPAEG